jgi:choice-of-anchor C domain-containing protein
MTKLATTLLAVCIFSGISAKAQTNLVTNGSFEMGPEIISNGGKHETFFAGSTVIPGWEVLNGSIDYVATSLWQASDGARSVEVVGTPGPGTIRQTFTTEIGKRYWVIFSLAGQPNWTHCSGEKVKALRVTAASKSQDFYFDVTGSTRANMRWVEKSFDFIANQAFTNLTFIGLHEKYCGAVIDNVRVFLVN